MSNLLDSGNRYGPIADISASRKSVAKIMVLAQPWMIDSGLLTPIMKVNRNEVQAANRMPLVWAAKRRVH